MLEVKNLVKQYGNKHAVNDISFTVERGEIVGFLGPNGAGKSTTMNIITGYLSSTSGTVTIDGHEILDDPIAAKSKIGYLPEHPPLYLDMTVKDYLRFIYDLKKVKLPREEHIQSVCKVVKIDHVYHRIIKNLSKGYRQRVGVAQALIGSPDLLILDEPTVGLDPKQIIEMRSLIEELGKSHTVLLSTHILPEAQAICKRILVINEGKLVADDSPEHLSRALGGDKGLLVQIEGPVARVRTALSSIPGVASCDAMGEKSAGVFEFVITPKGDNDVRREVFAVCRDRNWPLLQLNSNDLSLEEIFLRLTSGAYVPGAKKPVERRTVDRSAPTEAPDAAAEPAPAEAVAEPAAEESNGGESK